MVRLEVFSHAAFDTKRVSNSHGVLGTLVHGVMHESFLPYLKRLVLRLLHEFGNDTTAFELLAGNIVEVRGELSKGSEFTVLSQGKTDTTAEFFVVLCLCVFYDLGF